MKEGDEVGDAKKNEKECEANKGVEEDEEATDGASEITRVTRMSGENKTKTTKRTRKSRVQEARMVAKNG